MNNKVIDLPPPERIPRRPDGSINVEQLEREHEWRTTYVGHYRGCTAAELTLAAFEQDAAKHLSVLAPFIRL